MKVVLLLPSATVPGYASDGAGGLDLTAAERVVVPPSRVTRRGFVCVGRTLVRTGIAIQLPERTVGRVASRSGLSTRFNIEVGAGWIDSDYRGELLVEMKNFGDAPVTIEIGDRFAQLFVLRTTRVRPRKANKLGTTVRGAQGFGSTGLS